MEIIKQKATVWGDCPLCFNQALKRIEKAGRQCYQSLDKIGPYTAKPFIERILKPKPAHLSVTEHSNLVFYSGKMRFPGKELRRIKSEIYSDFIYTRLHKGRIYVYGNFRAWYEMMKNQESSVFSFFDLPDMLPYWLKNYTRATDLKNVPRFARAVSVCFVTSRDVSHEIVRHRPAAYSQESQRYVKYDNIKFIEPHWYSSCFSRIVRKTWEGGMLESSERYSHLISMGVKPQDARTVLPNSTATSLIMTAYLPEWDHVFDLRCAPSAYPPIRELMSQARKQMSAY